MGRLGGPFSMRRSGQTPCVKDAARPCTAKPPLGAKLTSRTPMSPSVLLKKLHRQHLFTFSIIYHPHAPRMQPCYRLFKTVPVLPP